MLVKHHLSQNISHIMKSECTGSSGSESYRGEGTVLIGLIDLCWLFYKNNGCYEYN